MTVRFCEACGHNIALPHLNCPNRSILKKYGFCKYCRRHVFHIHDNGCPNQRESKLMKEYKQNKNDDIKKGSSSYTIIPLQTQTLYAFWKYDLCPYVLGGKIIKFCEDGYISAEGYNGMRFKPLAILPDQHGRNALRQITELQTEYRMAEKALKHTFAKKAQKALDIKGEWWKL